MTTATSPRAPHHDGSTTYRGPAPTTLGGSVRLRVHVPAGPDGSPGAQRVHLRAVRDGEPRFTELRRRPLEGASAAAGDGSEWWEGELPLVNPRTSYRFLVESVDGTSVWLTAEGTYRRDVSDRADFVIDACEPPPSWVADQVAYQIFPDRFGRSEAAAARDLPDWAVPCEWEEPVVAAGGPVGRQLYGGDLDGVVAHLDHLVSLGVTTLYLTPVFEGRSNHRYDAVSFDRVDPVLGGDAAYHRLIEAAHARGLRVLGDLTTNHTGMGHEWFLAAQADPGCTEAEFYLFHDHPGEYHSWLDHRSLPSLRYTSAELRRRMVEGPDSVVGRWLAAGLDGWRIDVANMTGRQGAVGLTREVARAIRETMAQVKPDAWLLAEHFFDATEDLVGESWHGIMDYTGSTFPLWRWLVADSGPGAGADLGRYAVTSLPASEIVATMREVHARYPWTAVTASTVHLDSHDLPRFRTVVGGGGSGGIDTTRHGQARERHILGVALQMTLPGVPALFAGDELGLTATTGEHARTPMPWGAPETWDLETLAAYRALIALRRSHEALRHGSLRWLSAGEDHLTFVREHESGRVLVHAVRPRPLGSAPSSSAPDGETRVIVPVTLLGGGEPTTLWGEGLTDVSDGVGKAWLLPTTPGAHIYAFSGAGLAWS